MTKYFIFRCHKKDTGLHSVILNHLQLNIFPIIRSSQPSLELYLEFLYILYTNKIFPQRGHP